MTRERKNTTVFTSTYKGHELIIREMIWGKRIDDSTRVLAPNYYCGYVELLPDDYYYDHLDEAEDELEVQAPDGVTYAGVNEHVALPADKEFVGFYTASHYRTYSFDTVKQDCFSLIDQIIERNYDTPTGVLC